MDEESEGFSNKEQSDEGSQLDSGNNVTRTRILPHSSQFEAKQINVESSVIDANHIDTVVATPREDHGGLEYLPLVLRKLIDVPEDSEIPGVEFKMHVGDPHAQIAEEDAFADLPFGCLIQKQKEKGVKVAV